MTMTATSAPMSSQSVSDCPRKVFWLAGLTTSVYDAEPECCWASVTVTVTVNVPEAVGAQERDAVSDEVHPVGSPV